MILPASRRVGRVLCHVSMLAAVSEALVARFPKARALPSRPRLHQVRSAVLRRGASTMSSISEETASSAEVSSHQNSGVYTLDTLPFDNVVVRELPIDPEARNYVRQVPNSCFSRVEPDPVDNPVIVATSPAALGLLGLGPGEGGRDDAAEYFSGNKLFPGAEPHAHCYCGHQFGSFAGQLGDGAAMYLGQVEGPSGSTWEMQFKGSGRTPYSRTADGRKVLRSSIREFLCSEAMHFLNIPSTRAGALVTSDTRVHRDVFYTGNVIQERASIVLRLAPTFLRFGSFEIFKGRDARTGRVGPSSGNVALLGRMLEYACRHFFPNAVAAGPEGSKARYLALYKEAVRSTAELVAAWQCVGFTHGVLNTDNMSLLGLTIDYGPYGFMDFYDPAFVPNGSDSGGRYSYEKQPEVCKWNLVKFAEALAPVLPLADSEQALSEYDNIFQAYYEGGMRRKLGLVVEDDRDGQLFESLFDVMAETSADFTNTFRELSGLDSGDDIAQVAMALVKHCASPQVKAKAMKRALDIGKPSIPVGQLQALWIMAQENPDSLAARFGAPKEALVAELRGEMGKLEAYTMALGRVEDLERQSLGNKSEEDVAKWSAWLEKYAARLHKENNEAGAGAADVIAKRKAIMGAANPAFVLRNWVAQRAIEAAERGDFSEVRHVLSLLEKPFDPVRVAAGKDSEGAGVGGVGPGGLDKVYVRPTPDWAADLVCTCSS